MELRNTLYCDCYRLVSRILGSGESLPNHICTRTAFKCRTLWAMQAHYHLTYDFDLADTFLHNAALAYRNLPYDQRLDLRFRALLPDGRVVDCDPADGGFLIIQGQTPPLVSYVNLVIRQWCARPLKASAFVRYQKRRLEYLETGETESELDARGLFAEMPAILLSSFFICPVWFGNYEAQLHKPSHVVGMGGALIEAGSSGFKEATLCAAEHKMWWETIARKQNIPDDLAMWLPPSMLLDGEDRGNPHKDENQPARVERILNGGSVQEEASDQVAALFPALPTDKAQYDYQMRLAVKRLETAVAKARKLSR